jgi:hypothetical protein
MTALAKVMSDSSLNRAEFPGGSRPLENQSLRGAWRGSGSLLTGACLTREGTE